MTLRTLLTLGRTSNLPTVWSNVVAGAVICGEPFGVLELVVLLLASSAFYEGGMFLNDAFDAEVDARERPTRPIPAGQISRGVVFRIGFGLLGSGLVALAVAPLVGLARPGLGALLGGTFTCAAILVYDRWHKRHALSPVVMGACRAGLYATAALAVSGKLEGDVLAAACSLLLYVVGLTHIARFETSGVLGRVWPTTLLLAPLFVGAYAWVERPRIISLLCFALSAGWTLRSLAFALRGGKAQIMKAVVTLIAGISLVDAIFISLYAPAWAVLGAFGAFLLTLKWQRRIPGT